jgi:hypothetical protein
MYGWKRRLQLPLCQCKMDWWIGREQEQVDEDKINVKVHPAELTSHVGRVSVCSTLARVHRFSRRRKMSVPPFESAYDTLKLQYLPIHASSSISTSPCVFQDLASFVMARALVEWERLNLPTIQPARHRSAVTIKSQDLADAFSLSTAFLHNTRRDLECMSRVKALGR